MRSQVPVLRGLAALVGSAMVGGVAVAGAVQSGVVPGLAPAVAAPAVMALAPPAPQFTLAPEAEIVRTGGGGESWPDAPPAGPAPALYDPPLYDPIAIPAPSAKRVNWGRPKALPEPARASDNWIDRVVPDGEHYGNTPRLYLFVGGGGQSAGLNYVPHVDSWGDDGWRRDGWSRDRLAVTGDAQAGIGIRRGPVQVSFGYVYRRTRTEVYETLILPEHEDRVAVTLSIKQ